MKFFLDAYGCPYIHYNCQRLIYGSTSLSLHFRYGPELLIAIGLHYFNFHSYPLLCLLILIPSVRAMKLDSFAKTLPHLHFQNATLPLHEKRTFFCRATAFNESQKQKANRTGNGHPSQHPYQTFKEGRATHSTRFCLAATAAGNLPAAGMVRKDVK